MLHCTIACNVCSLLFDSNCVTWNAEEGLWCLVGDREILFSFSCYLGRKAHLAIHAGLWYVYTKMICFLMEINNTRKGITIR